MMTSDLDQWIGEILQDSCSCHLPKEMLAIEDTRGLHVTHKQDFESLFVSGSSCQRTPEVYVDLA